MPFGPLLSPADWRGLSIGTYRSGVQDPAISMRDWGGSICRMPATGPSHSPGAVTAGCWHDVRMRGRSKTDWWGVVLEAPDGLALASFYSRLFGWDIAKEDPGGAAIQVPGTSSYLAWSGRRPMGASR
jgi:hypothetical protein